MRVFVTGVAGQLGYDVVNELKKRGHEAVGSDVTVPAEPSGAAFELLDITDEAAVEAVLTRVQPDAVVHCAAWTAVDLAEDADKVNKVRAINAGGTKNIAAVCKKLNCKMIYISTDYVFDGQGQEPWQPDCKDYKPLNVYGQTKLEGELAVVDCLMEEDACHKACSCPTRVVWKKLRDGLNQIVDGITLQDMLDDYERMSAEGRKE